MILGWHNSFSIYFLEKLKYWAVIWILFWRKNSAGKLLPGTEMKGKGLLDMMLLLQISILGMVIKGS